MNIEQLSSKFKLEFDHLIFQSALHNHSKEKIEKSFNELKEGYLSLVKEEDKKLAENLLNRYESKLKA